MASAASSIPQLAPVGNLSRYLRTIRKFPMLEPDEEYVLAKRWRDNADVEAAHRLVTSHLRLMVKIASGYQGYGHPFGELISEGNVGIMHALKRFDPDRGCRFASYAMWWINSNCQCAPSACEGTLVRPGTRPCIEGTVTRSQSCIEETLDLP
jgi:RNA polymerase sigma-32 factor